MTPFRSEKNTNWEGAFRVPCMIRWPGKIKAGAVSNEIVSGHDWLPTLLAAAGEPDIKEKLLKGHEAAGKTFKVHLDGYNQLALPDRQQDRRARAGVLLLQRRRRPGRPAVRELEDRVHGAAAPRARCGSGPSRSRRCGCPSSSTSAPTPTSGPTSPRTPITTGSSPSRTWCCRPGGDGQVPGHVQGVPTAAAGRELQHRPDHGPDFVETSGRLSSAWCHSGARIRANPEYRQRRDLARPSGVRALPGVP